MSKESITPIEFIPPEKYGGAVTLPFSADLYIGLAVIPDDKPIDLRWLLTSCPKSTVQDLFQYGLIELRDGKVFVTDRGHLYKETTSNLITLEKGGAITQVRLAKKRKNIPLEELRTELFENARKYNKISPKPWREMGIRLQWEAIQRYLLDPNSDHDRYYTVLTPKTKRLLREWGLLK
jgi:hypothetical protein